MNNALPKITPDIYVPKRDQRPDEKSTSFIAKRFVLVGNKKVSSKVLSGLLTEYLNRPITFQDLRNAADRVSEYYRLHGWLVRTQIPRQDVTDGIATIEIFEASLGDVLIENKSKHSSTARVEGWIYHAVPRTASLSLSKLDRALLTLNDLPDIQVASSLQEGKNPGETNLLLNVADKALVDGLIGTDNFGQSSTGQKRATANLNINRALGRGEQINVYGLYTEGSQYGRVAVTAPIGSGGLRVGINGSYLSYRLISPSFNQLAANGSSRTGGAELTYPIIRSRSANLFLLSNYLYSSFDNQANEATTSQYSSSAFLAGLSGNLLDDIAGGGINSGSLMASGGAVNLNASPSLAADRIGPRVNGNFTKLRYGFNRIQAVNSSLSAYVGASGQIASKNMDSSEQLYLGGPYGVRAYASGQGNASQGNLLTFELRQILSSKLLLTGFYDYATVRTYKTTSFTGAPLNNIYALQGMGISIAWVGPAGLQIKALWAKPTGSLPTSVTQTLNGNGGTGCSRFWLTVSLPL